MKKLLTLFFTLIFTLLLSFKAFGMIELETVTKYGTSDPVYHYGTNDPTKIPTELKFPKQQFRGVWVATVSQIDVPIHTSEQQYKDYYISILDNLEAYNMNAVVFQVRPMNDAFYESTLNPWSRYLTGTEGESPGWDPVAWMVEETHKRGMEFHAWLNPYRVTNTAVSNKEAYLEKLDEKNFARKHPDYVLVGEQNKLILNPGEPEVRQFIYDTIDEIVTKYDVDAIHFDDYFYPYDKITSSDDAHTYNQYNPNNLSLDDWRRENVDLLIKGIKDLLTDYNQTNNKAVQLGISPFGIWANKKDHPDGSNTNGGNSYFSHYADTRKWVLEEWIDYITPQNYFEFEKQAAPYADVADWWVKQVESTNVNLYMGQGIYRHLETSSTSYFWQVNDSIVYDQLKYNGKYQEIDGSIFFSYKHFDDSRFNDNSALVGDREKIKNDAYQYKVLPSPVTNVDSVAPSAPTNLNIVQEANGFRLTWDKDTDAKAYYVYRYNPQDKAYLYHPENIVAVVNGYDKTSMEFLDTSADPTQEYKYYVTAFDRANNESDPTGKNTANMVVLPDDASVLFIQERLDSTYIRIKEIDRFVANINAQKPELQTLISQLGTVLSDIESDYNALLTEVNDLKDRVNQLDTKKAEIEAKITEIDDQIYSLLLDKSLVNQEEITSLEAEIASLKALHNALFEDIATYEAEIEALKPQRIEIYDQITDLTGDITDINTGFTQIKTDQTDLNYLMGKLQFYIDELNVDKTVLTSENQEVLDELNGYLNKYGQLLAIQSTNNTIIENYTNDYDAVVETNNQIYSGVVLMNGTLVSSANTINDFETNYGDKEEVFTDFENNITYLKSLIEPEEPTEPNEPSRDEDTEKNNNVLLIGGIVGGIALMGSLIFVFIRKNSK